jgi:ABC-type nitrate/sulfonate/bicarbonate transport system permease component
MRKWRFDRTTIFLAVVVVLYFWDLVYFLGITDPEHLPHPFRIFRLTVDSELFRIFRSVLRQMIFLSLPGSVIGIAVAHGVLRNRRVTDVLLQFLRFAVWLPFLLLITLPSEMIVWAVAAAVLFSCYNYLVARALLNCRGRDVINHVGRETILQLFFFFMLAQLLLFTFWESLNIGLQMLAMVAIFVAIVNWVFHSNFEASAHAREIVLEKQLERANRSSLIALIVIVIVCLLLWQAFSSLWFYGHSVSPIAPVSPLGAFKAMRNMFESGEIWLDVKVSVLLEMFLGLVACCLMAFVVAAICISKPLRSALFFFLSFAVVPTMLTAYSLAFTFLLPLHSTIGVWQTRVVVAFFTFYPFFQSWCAFRNQGRTFRILLALDDALPFAFVAMIYGERIATAGLGFEMIVAIATYQWDKAIAVFLITVGLLVCLSSCLRWIARRFYTPAPAANAIPAQAT